MESESHSKHRPAPASSRTEDAPPGATDDTSNPSTEADKPLEIGGPRGLEPTRYGDWERKGRCVDF